LWNWGCWHRLPNRQKRFSEWSGSRSWLIKIEDIEACEKAAIEPYVPRPQRGPSVTWAVISGWDRKSIE
jgi:hypothetical protein